MGRNAIWMTVFLLLGSLSTITFGTQNVSADTNWTDVSINTDGHHAIDLGTINAGKELEIDFSADDDIDVLLMTDTQYAAWQGGATTHVASGSDYEDNSDAYVYTVETGDHYYLVLDNSDEPAAGGASTGSTITASGSVTIVDAATDTIRTRAWLGQNTEKALSHGSVSGGRVLTFGLSCDIGLTSSDDIDFLVMTDPQHQDHTSGTATTWNRHATFLEECAENWEFETSGTETWWFILENGPEGDADAIAGGIMVDVQLSHRTLVSLIEVTDTTRMIDAGDQWRVDLGYVLAGSTYNFIMEYDSSGLGIGLDDLDVLVMATAEADDFTDGNSATILGHASGLDTGPIGETWDYRFPASGYYSVIFDNSDEPSGGAGGSSNIHTELSITDISIPNLFGNVWTGWYQSRHLVEEDGWMAMDLGTLDSGDDLYYYIGNHNDGGSVWPNHKYDALLMDDANYQLYIGGGDPTIISGGSNLEILEEVPVIENWTASSTGDYWLVLDGADGPSGGADANGDWLFDFIVLSTSQSISSPQAMDSNYEQDVTNSGSNTPPDTDGDGVPDYRDDCENTPSSEAADSDGCGPSQRDSDGDGVSDADDQCAGHDDNIDEDNDGIPDGCDSLIDSDGDGVSNSEDQCEGHDDNVDIDSDGIPDGCDPLIDSDGDGVGDSVDLCPDSDTTSEDVDADGCTPSQLDTDQYSPIPSASVVDRLEYRGQVENHGTNTVSGTDWDVYMVTLGSTGDLTLHFDASNSSDGDANDGTNGIKKYVWKVFFDNPWDQQGGNLDGSTYEVLSSVSHSWTYRFQYITVDPSGQVENKIRIELTVYDQADKPSLNDDKFRMYFVVVDEGYGDEEPDVEFTNPADGSSQTGDSIFVNGSVLSGSEGGDVMIEIALEEATLDLSPSQKFPKKTEGAYNSISGLGDGDSFSIDLDISDLYTDSGSTQTIYIKITEGDGSRWTIYKSIDINLVPKSGGNGEVDCDAEPDHADCISEAVDCEAQPNHTDCITGGPEGDDQGSDGSSSGGSSNESGISILIIGGVAGVILLVVGMGMFFLMGRRGRKIEPPVRGLM